MPDPLAAALHEVRHAAAVVLLGGRCNRVVIGETPMSRRGRLVHGFTTFQPAASWGVAERLTVGAANVGGTGDEGDRVQAEQLLGRPISDSEWLPAARRAADLLRDHAGALGMLARRLEAEGVLEHADIEQALGRRC